MEKQWEIKYFKLKLVSYFLGGLNSGCLHHFWFKGDDLFEILVIMEKLWEIEFSEVMFELGLILPV